MFIINLGIVELEKGYCKELEIVEKVILEGVTRYRVRVKGTNIFINVAADSAEEAYLKARKILENRIEC